MNGGSWGILEDTLPPPDTDTDLNNAQPSDTQHTLTDEDYYLHVSSGLRSGGLILIPILSPIPIHIAFSFRPLDAADWASLIGGFSN